MFSFSNYLDAQNNGPGGSRRDGRVNGRRISIQPRLQIDTSQCSTIKFRTIDGTCNNLSSGRRMEYGSTDIELRRATSSFYSSSDPFNAMAGENRPSPRAISNIVVGQSRPLFSQQNLSSLVFTWGQFLDHDISLTPEGHTEFVPIPLPINEPLFGMDIPFLRSEVFMGTGQTGPRQQINLITSWIDGSMVYGSEIDRAQWLRTHDEGKLKVSNGNLLPFNTVDGEYGSAIDTTAPSMAGADPNGKMWVAGDVRAGEQVGLTCLHTLFVREHNRICSELVSGGMNNDEEIYQEARKIVVALIQKISFKEFLPALGIELKPYNGYNNRIRPDISNEFATAAYRLGHTMVTGGVGLLDPNCQSTPDSLVSLIEAYFNPEVIRNHGIDTYLKGLTVEVQAEVDPFIVDELRNFLFSDPNQSPLVAGLDLAAANIQRGRDHGLPDYNSLRAHYLGRGVRDFNDISRDSLFSAKLAQAYQGNIHDIDAWIGLLCEDHVNGTSLGPTLHAILEDQFERLRDGDRFFYENYLSRRELSEIDHTRLSDVIERNTLLNDLAQEVMFASSCANSPGPTNNELARQFDVFPNPTEGLLRIRRHKKDLKIEAYSVVDVNGITIVNRRDYGRRIDISSLLPGTYFIQVHTNKGTAAKRVSLIY